MKTPRGAVLAAGMVAVLALTGCASRGSVRQVRSEVAELRGQGGGRRKAPAPAPPPAREKRVEARPAEPDRPATPSDPADQLYSAALANFRAHEHGQAVLEFTGFIARNPQHPLAANAQFWVAEAYYLQRDYRQAVAEPVKGARL